MTTWYAVVFDCPPIDTNAPAAEEMEKLRLLANALIRFLNQKALELCKTPAEANEFIEKHEFGKYCRIEQKEF